MSRDVFISYRFEDKSAAERICAGLERNHIPCWMAPRDISPGEEWAGAIVEGIRSARVLVVVLSSRSKNARQIAREAELADRHGLPIITFRIENVDPPSALSYFLGNLQWLDGFGDQFDRAVARLGEVVRQIPNHAAPLPPSPVSVTTPAALPESTKIQNSTESRRTSRRRVLMAGGAVALSLSTAVIIYRSPWNHNAEYGRLTGDWRGTLDFRYSVVLHVTGNGQATADSPDEGIYGVGYSYRIVGNKIFSNIPALRARYTGTIKGNEISGTYTQNGFSFPLDFTSLEQTSRTGMIGEWKGILAYSLPVVFHFDGSGTGSVDSPNQNAYGRTLRYSLSGNRVTIDMPQLRASYVATFHGGTLTGDFNQNGRKTPLSVMRN